MIEKQLEKPVWLVLIYAVAGAFFMPLLGITLLYMNNRSSWLGSLRNGPATNLVLVTSVIVFGLLVYDTVMRQFG